MTILPSMPYTIETEKGFDQEIDGRMRILIASSGADTKRYITMRHKPSTNQWFLEDQMLLSHDQNTQVTGSLGIRGSAR